MDSPLDAISPAPRRNPSLRTLIALLAILILIAIVATTLPSPTSGEKIAWLTPAQMAQAKGGGRLANLEQRFQWLINPFHRLFHRGPKALLLFDSSILDISAASGAQLSLGAPVSTNADGMHAWILSPPELNSFLKRLKETPNISTVSRPRISTADGVQSKMSVGNTILVGGALSLVGLSMDLTPKVSGDTFKLLVEVTDTETNTAVSPGLLSFKTNFTIACRATIPNGGALVVDAGNSGTNHYWLVLTPQLMDAAGKPIKTSPRH